MAPVIHKCEGKCPRGYVCVCRKKQKKRKKKAEKQIVAGAAVKVSGVPRAVPTSLLLERQGVSRLIKNARTAGLEINQGAYDAYNEAFERRAAAARYGIPSAAHTAGVRSRQALRNLVGPSVGPRARRERSQRTAADPTVMADAAEARRTEPLPTVPTTDTQTRTIADTPIKKEKSVVLSPPSTMSRPNVLARAFSRTNRRGRGRVAPTPGGIAAIRAELEEEKGDQPYMGSSSDTSPSGVPDASPDQSGFVRFSDLEMTPMPQGPPLNPSQLRRISEISNMFENPNEVSDFLGTPATAVRTPPRSAPAERDPLLPDVRTPPATVARTQFGESGARHTRFAEVGSPQFSVISEDAGDGDYLGIL